MEWICCNIVIGVFSAVICSRLITPYGEIRINDNGSICRNRELSVFVFIHFPGARIKRNRMQISPKDCELGILRNINTFTDSINRAGGIF